jgi:putative ABC transport system permease protein
MNPRWSKLRRDAGAERGRFALMLLAMAVALTVLGAVLGAYAVLTREMAANYLGTQPAHATLEMPDGVSAEVLAAARRHPLVAQAEAGDVIPARARVGDDWRPVLLFAADDPGRQQIGRVLPRQGRSTPEPGGVLLERTATRFLAAPLGAQLSLRMPRGREATVRVDGLVHDPGLAPAWQERTGYVYLDRTVLRALGEDGVLHELRVRLRDTPETPAAMQAAAEALALALQHEGHAVAEVRVPPPRLHPHQRQMTTVLLLLLAFSVMMLVLAGVLVSATLAALLARQVREIGVMKTLGARNAQLAGLYMALAAAIGLAALLPAVLLGVGGARVFSGAVAQLLNLRLEQPWPPLWVLGVQAAAALGVPVAVAAWPIWRACRMTVRDALDRHGAAGERLRLRTGRWPPALRDALRRPSRLALTLALLAVGGAVFMTALNVSRSWEQTIAKVYLTRHYDVEVRLRTAAPAALRETLLRLPGVREAESWGYSPGAFARLGRIDMSQAYPDRGHGAFAVMAPPSGTGMIDFPLRAGRWLRPDDQDAVVLNHAAAAQQPHLNLGDPVLLSTQDAPSTWYLAGIVEEIGAAGVAYVNPGAFERVSRSAGRVRIFRLATDARTAGERTLRIRQIESALRQAGADVETAQPLSELRTAMGDHIVILIRALMALASAMAVVGGLGLASTLSIDLLERTRELAVMKTLGATRARLIGTVLAQAQLVAGTSAVAALLLSLPLTGVLDMLVGRLGFVAPLPFTVSPLALLLWLGLVQAVAALAAWLPARRAADLPIAQALGRV